MMVVFTEFRDPRVLLWNTLFRASLKYQNQYAIVQLKMQTKLNTKGVEYKKGNPHLDRSP